MRTHRWSYGPCLSCSQLLFFVVQSAAPLRPWWLTGYFGHFCIWTITIERKRERERKAWKFSITNKWNKDHSFLSKIEKRTKPKMSFPKTLDFLLSMKWSYMTFAKSEKGRKVCQMYVISPSTLFTFVTDELKIRKEFKSMIDDKETKTTLTEAISSKT